MKLMVSKWTIHGEQGINVFLWYILSLFKAHLLFHIPVVFGGFRFVLLHMYLEHMTNIMMTIGKDGLLNHTGINPFALTFLFTFRIYISHATRLYI